MLPTRLLLLPSSVLAFALPFVSACGDDGATDGGGGTGTGAGAQSSTTGTMGSGSTSTGSGPECTEPTPQPGTPYMVDFTTVTAIARDETDAVITNVELQLCGSGTSFCEYATTNMIGQATFMNGAGMPMDRPMFKTGDSLLFGKVGYPYSSSSPSPLPGIFPRMQDSGMPIVAGSAVSVSGATIEPPAGGKVCVDVLIYDTPDKQTFRAKDVRTQIVPDVTGDPDFVMVYALGPVDTLFEPPARLTVDNYAGLPAGSAVELWGQELNVGEFFGGYGEWVRLDSGTVSSDGMTVSTDNGLPVLLTVAIKPI